MCFLFFSGLEFGLLFDVSAFHFPTQAGNNRAAVARREAAIPQAIDELFKLEPDPSSGTRTEEEVEDARRVQVTDARRESSDEGGRVNFLERINEKASDVPIKNDSVSDIMGSHVTRARTESKALACGWSLFGEGPLTLQL